MKRIIKITIAVIMLALYMTSVVSLASALTIESVFTNPDQIEPGETSTISIEIENDSDKDIKDVSVSLVLVDPTGFINIPFAPFDSSTEYSFDEIEEDDSKTAKFKIIALSDAESEIYKIPVHIQYKEDEVIKTKDSLISIKINSEPILGVNPEDGLLLKGKENEFRIEIINKGLSKVKFLEVEIGTSTYYNVLSSNNVYIGDVDSDDFDSAEFRVFFKGNAPNIVNVPVSLKYRDAMNKEYNENLNVQLNVYTKEKAVELGLIEESKTTLYIGVILGLAAVYIIYKRIKKRRQAKLSEEF